MNYLEGLSAHEMETDTAIIVAALMTMPDEVVRTTLQRPLNPGESLAIAMHTRCAVANLAVAPYILYSKLGFLPSIYHLRSDYGRALKLTIDGKSIKQDKHHVALIEVNDGCIGYDFASAPFASLNPELGVPLIVVPRQTESEVIARLDGLYHTSFRYSPDTYGNPFVTRK